MFYHPELMKQKLLPELAFFSISHWHKFFFSACLEGKDQAGIGLFAVSIVAIQINKNKPRKKYLNPLNMETELKM